MRDSHAGGPQYPTDQGLATQEEAILAMLAEGTPRPQMANRLRCSLSTLDRFVAGLRERAGARTNIELVVRAVRDGRI